MKSVALMVAILVVSAFGCGQSVAEKKNVPSPQPEIQPTPEPKPTKPPIPIEIASLSALQLCDRLADIQILPTKDPTITDPIYEVLISKGDSVIPCLIERISDKWKIPDPRYSVPHWQHYAVGDTAVFILLDILSDEDDLQWEKLMKEILPPKYSEEWKTNGIYAYFNYVSEPKNRIELQRWWKKWLREK